MVGRLAGLVTISEYSIGEIGETNKIKHVGCNEKSPLEIWKAYQGKRRLTCGNAWEV